MWSSAAPAIKEEEEHIYFFATLAETLDKVNESPICVEASQMRRAAYILPVLNRNLKVALWSQQLCPFLCQNCSPKVPVKIPKHVYFRLSSDDPICMEIPLSFVRFSFGVHSCISIWPTFGQMDTQTNFIRRLWLHVRWRMKRIRGIQVNPLQLYLNLPRRCNSTTSAARWKSYIFRRDLFVYLTQNKTLVINKYRWLLSKQTLLS